MTERAASAANAGAARRMFWVQRLLRDPSGAVTIEYLIVFVFVGLTTTLALLGLIPQIFNHYANQRALLYLPYP